MFKVKMLAIAIVMLLGAAGVALASGQVSGPAGDNSSVQNGSGGTESPDSTSDELSDAAGNQYGPGTEADDATEDQYGDDDQAETDDIDDIDDIDDETDDVNDDADEVDDQENYYESARDVSGTDSGERENDMGHAGTGSVTNTETTGATGRTSASTRDENDD